MRSSTFRITDNARANRLNYNIKKDNNKLPYETYSFLKIVSNAFDLSPNIEAHMTFVLLNLKNDHHMLCGGSISMENMVLASAIYAMECSGLPCYEDTDISGFVSYLYRHEQQKQQLTKIYELYQNLQDIFYDSDKQVLPYLPDRNPHADHVWFKMLR